MKIYLSSFLVFIQFQLAFQFDLNFNNIQIIYIELDRKLHFLMPTVDIPNKARL